MERQYRRFSRPLSFVLVFSAATALLSSTGCSSLHFVSQAAHGQLKIIQRARPIEDVIADERTRPRVSRLLKEIPSILAFGQKYGIQPTPNYREYVAWDDPYVSYVVTACPEFEFKPKEWSFPIVGSFTYLGWFDRKNAESMAQELRTQGWDVDVRGASAFSTLGWFRDPVLSTMIPPGEEAMGELVNVLLHESVHATLYISGQSYFNEALASFVADRLTSEYLRERFGAQSPELQTYLKSSELSERRSERMHLAFEQLSHVYQSAQSLEEKRSEKRRILKALQIELQWKKELNNATLAQFRFYGLGIEEFPKLWEQTGGSWDVFWERLKKLKSTSFPVPQMEKFGVVLGL
jgi:predicted aminopeptidase